MTEAGKVTVSLGELLNSCFVIMPFGGAMDRVYQSVYQPAIRAAQLEPVRGDEIYGSGRIMRDVWKAIRAARCMLADLTGRNGNVLYELGIGHTLAKPALIVTAALSDVPFDLRHLRCIEYDKDHPGWGQRLAHEIERNLSDILKSNEWSELFPDIQVQGTFPPLAPQLAGTWEIVDEFDGGVTTGTIQLEQNGNELNGTAVTTEESSDPCTVEQTVVGRVHGDSVTLNATSFRFLEGHGSYDLDVWRGKLVDEDTIEGTSTDRNDEDGHFRMTRKG